MLNLDEIEERARDESKGWHAGETPTATATRLIAQDVPALVAEVRRMRVALETAARKCYRTHGDAALADEIRGLA